MGIALASKILSSNPRFLGVVKNFSGRDVMP